MISLLHPQRQGLYKCKGSGLPSAEKGLSLSPGLCLLRAQPFGKTQLPPLHNTIQMQVGNSLQNCLQDLPHSLTDEETETYGDEGIFPHSRSVPEPEEMPSGF